VFEYDYIFFTAAQRAFAAAAIFARASGEMVRFFLTGASALDFTGASAFAFIPLIFAQRAFAAAANFARCAVEIFRFPFTGDGADAFTVGAE